MKNNFRYGFEVWSKDNETLLAHGTADSPDSANEGMKLALMENPDADGLQLCDNEVIGFFTLADFQ